MSLAIALLVQGLHLLLMLAVAPVALGVSRVVAARLAGRAGPPATQPWRDLLRLARKQTLVAEHASPLFLAAPAVAFAAIVLAAALVPSFTLGMAAAPCGDLIVVAGLLLLARATRALAAMEAGTALGGLGASRSMTLALATEPALLLAVLPLAVLAGSTNLDAMAAALREGAGGLRLPLLLALAAVAVVALAVLRPPPAATLSFTEVASGEAAVALEYSGRPLALLHYGEALRRLVWLALFADLAVPAGLAQATGNPAWWLLGIAAWAGKIAALTAAVATWQALRPARPGAAATAEALGVAVLLGLLATALLFAGQGSA